MTTLLVIDIGNTNVSMGIFDYPKGARATGELSHHWRIGTHREQTSDEVGLTLRSLFDHAEWPSFDPHVSSPMSSRGTSSWPGQQP